MLKNSRKHLSAKALSVTLIACASLAVIPAYSVVDGLYSESDSSSVNLSVTGVVSIESKDSLADDSSKPASLYTVTQTTPLKELLSKHKLNIEDFTKLDGTPLSGDETVSVGQELKLFSKGMTTSTEDTDITLPDVVEMSDELYVGESQVVTEQVVGKATRNVVSYDVVSKDGSVKTEKEETFTVKVKPVAKVVKEGTKQRPAAQQTSSWSSGRPPFYRWAGYIYDASPYMKGDWVDTALQQVGKPYVWAAAGPNAFDCSGLVQWVYKQNGVSVPRVAAAQGRAGQPVSWSEAKRGDLIWTSGHIGIYLGDGMMVHASNPQTGVVITSVSWMVGQGAQVARIGG